MHAHVRACSLACSPALLVDLLTYSLTYLLTYVLTSLCRWTASAVPRRRCPALPPTPTPSSTPNSTPNLAPTAYRLPPTPTPTPTPTRNPTLTLPLSLADLARRDRDAHVIQPRAGAGACAKVSTPGKPTLGQYQPSMPLVDTLSSRAALARPFICILKRKAQGIFNTHKVNLRELASERHRERARTQCASSL